MKDFLKNYWWVIVATVGLSVMLTLGVPEIVTTVQDKKQAVQDSITELNQLWKNEQRGNAQTFYILDSISKTGDSIAWVNFKKQTCFIKVTPKK